MRELTTGSGDRNLPRVRVVVGGERVPVWVACLRDALEESGQVEFVGVSVAASIDSGDAAAEGAYLSLNMASLAWADTRLFARRATLLQPAVRDDWCFGGCSSPDCADIVLDLTGGSVSRDALEATEGSVWWLTGVPTSTDWPGIRRPEIAAAVIEGRRTIGFDLVAWDRKRDSPAIFATATCPTHPCSPLMTAAYLAGTALRLVVKELERASADGSPHAIASAPPGESIRKQASSRRGRRAHDSCRASWLAPAYIVRTGSWGARRIGWIQQWYLLVGAVPLEWPVVDPGGLSPIIPPAGHFWADPAVVADGASTHVFFEDFEHEVGKGRISVLSVDGAGRHGPARCVLEADSHLSYPFVFRHDGRLFMIPESADAGTVDLYECLNLPQQWQFRRSLLRNVRLVDASIVQWDGLWWMFACLQLPSGLRGADVLVLYVAEDPVIGDWREHPASPLLADVRGSRPAGAPFVREGRLYRPAQDGSRGYGWGIAVNEVLSLTPTRFEERRVAMVTPDFGRGVCGVHTMNRAGGRMVMDACRWAPRHPSPRPHA